ncbi:hypothetical protein I4F81_012135 [Pyropia yezoensis]|uniref:Uncharacterized protein n=1 Tax=Pyropia yezoensis TaxID=2788 RepID=A0ACC3CHT5_PYRYE|nr:hypothetical protein I4F81_012135 [Neopyropia yezoensis]
MASDGPGAVRVAILGASGYTGAELLRLLSSHPHTSIAALSGERSAGSPMGAVFPHLAFGPPGGFVASLPDLTTTASVTIIAQLPLDTVRVVDLSADFRLRDVDMYATWYGAPHAAVELQAQAVYGLTELARDAVRGARLVANPGCYPTSAQLPLVPLLTAGLIKPADIIVDAKSGVTGAGRAAKVGTLFCEAADGMSAYGVASHRHAPEIEQGLSDAAGQPVDVVFTPHLVPLSRGILSTIYVKLADGATADSLRECLATTYAAEPFVHVLPSGVAPPHTRHVRGSNHAVMGVYADRVAGRAILVCVIDNIVKGASGQAIQNMNVMCGFDESAGLGSTPVFP